MPRQIEVLRSFHQGNMNVIEPLDKDITAGYGINVDGLNPIGTIRGRHGDNPYNLWIPTDGLKRAVTLQRNTGERDIVYWQPTTTAVRSCQDFEGVGQADSELIDMGSSSDVFFAEGREIRAFQEGHTPVWIGRQTEKQFQQTLDPALYALDARCIEDGQIPIFYKTVVAESGVDTYYVGIEWQGTRVFFIKGDGTIRTLPTGSFVKLQGIAQDEATTGYIWILDLVQDQQFVMYQLDVATMEVKKTITATTSAATFTTTLTPSDILVTSYGTYGRIFVAITNTEYVDSPTYVGGRVVYCDIEATSTTKTMTNYSLRWPLNQDGDGVLGEWQQWDGAQEVEVAGDQFYTPMRVCLSRYGTTNYIGMFFRTGEPFNYLSFVDASNSVYGTLNGRNYICFFHQSTVTRGALYDITSPMTTLPAERILQLKHRWHVGIMPDPTYEEVILGWRDGDTYYGYLLHDDTDDLLTNSKFSENDGYIGNEYSGWAADTVASRFPFTDTTQARLCVGGANKIAGMRSINSYALDSWNFESKTAGPTLTRICSAGMVTLTTAQSSETGWTANRKYYYRWTLEYDGYQESPLSSIVVSITNGASVTTAKTVTFRIDDITDVNKRVTGLGLYRASSTDTNSVPTTLYRKVATISLNDPKWAVASGVATYVYNDSVEETGPTYENNTGIAETIDKTYLSYGLGVITLDYMFVARPSHEMMEDMSHMIFRSKIGRYDMFDWTQDYVVLPFKPVALAAAFNRVFAFDENRTAIIDPQGMFIEEIYDGRGAYSQDMVCVSDHGVLFANRNNVYLFNGQQFETVADPIMEYPYVNGDDRIAGTMAWREFWYGPHEHATIRFDGYNNCYHIFAVDPNDVNIVFSFTYFPAQKMWAHWQYTSTTTGDSLGAFVDYRGYCYLSYVGELEGQTLYQIATTLGNNSRTGYTWISKKMSMDHIQHKKKFYYLAPNPTDYPYDCVIVRFDDGVWTNIVSYEQFTPPTVFKTMQIKLYDDGGYETPTRLNELVIVHRPLAGERV